MWRMFSLKFHLYKTNGINHSSINGSSFHAFIELEKAKTQKRKHSRSKRTVATNRHKDWEGCILCFWCPSWSESYIQIVIVLLWALSSRQLQSPFFLKHTDMDCLVPMKERAFLLSTPLGSRWKSYSTESTTTVWPALLPPCKEHNIPIFRRSASVRYPRHDPPASVARSAVFPRNWATFEVLPRVEFFVRWLG